MVGTKKLRFKDLGIGDTFEFDSVRKFPTSGFARGPWIKLSSRKYERIDHGLDSSVGSINVEVERVSATSTNKPIVIPLNQRSKRSSHTSKAEDANIPKSHPVTQRRLDRGI